MDEGDLEPFRALGWRCWDALRLSPGASGARTVAEVIWRRSMGGTLGEDLVDERAVGSVSVIYETRVEWTCGLRQTWA
jgi:hypothetical protein